VSVVMGAARGVAPIWRMITTYLIGVGIQPGAWDAAKLSAVNSSFKRWVDGEGLAAPERKDAPQKTCFLTKPPYCSSLLQSRNDRRQGLSFADYFIFEPTETVEAVTLHAALAAKGLGGMIGRQALPADMNCFCAYCDQGYATSAVRRLYHDFLHSGWCLRPTWSRVEHIGFDASATNAADAGAWANPPLRALWQEATRPAARPFWRRVWGRLTGGRR
jgi:hypothetical protein